MQSWLEISKSALLNNYQSFTKLSGAAQLAPVLKSNAYGHGLEIIYEAIKEKSPPWICVAYLHEAAFLRRQNYKGRILLVTPVESEELQQCSALGVEIFLSHEGLLDAWLKNPAKVKLHVKVDTGLSRQGFSPSQLEHLCARLSPFKNDVVGICTHFANVEDVLEHDYAKLQLKRFMEATQLFQAQGYRLLRHCASSASCLLMPETRLDLCRIGISLYGLWPSGMTRLSYLQLNSLVEPLEPALSWKCRIALCKKVPKGAFIGYGCTYKAERDMQIAVLPFGYADGYPRVAGSGKSYVLIRGERSPLLGRISMNISVCDVSHISSASIGDEVVMIGHQHEETISSEQIADWSQTIHYEVITRINPALPRKLV